VVSHGQLREITRETPGTVAAPFYRHQGWPRSVAPATVATSSALRWQMVWPTGTAVVNVDHDQGGVEQWRVDSVAAGTGGEVEQDGVCPVRTA
jgi:hypothetical protein